MTYDEALVQWVATWHPVFQGDRVWIDLSVEPGCDTCGFGEDGHMSVLIQRPNGDGREVTSFKFSEMNTALEGILRAALSPVELPADPGVTQCERCGKSVMRDQLDDHMQEHWRADEEEANWQALSRQRREAVLAADEWLQEQIGAGNVIQGSKKVDPTFPAGTLT